LPTEVEEIAEVEEIEGTEKSGDVEAQRRRDTEAVSVSLAAISRRAFPVSSERTQG
jgi:hypothetical protein